MDKMSKAGRIEIATLATLPHNGDGRPNLRFPDPISGELIGGQVAAMRMTMRYTTTVYPWARRQGKTKTKQFVIPNEATITSGPYWAGIVLPDHATAFKIFEDFRDSWGGMVKDSKGDDKSQDRWIDLYPLSVPAMPAPKWFTPSMAERWELCRKKPNTSCRTYFWSGKHPHYQGIQGFPHPFHRIDWDEVPQIRRQALGIVRPMLRDVCGHESFTGTPMAMGEGNDWFSDFWDIAGTDEARHSGWFRMQIPDGTSPHVPRVDLDEARRSMTEAEIRQTLYAEFLNNEGAVFSNLDAVFILPAMPTDSHELAWVRDLLRRAPIPSVRYWVYNAAPIPGRTYGVSVDWARSIRGDYTVLTVWDFTTACQVACFRWRGEDFNEQMEWVLSVQRHYRAAQCHADANGMGVPMADFMRRRHAVGFIGHKFGSNKPDYVRRAQIMFREASVALIDFPEQRAEFKSYSAFESDTPGSDRVVYSHPEGKHDDIVDSFLHVAPTMTIVGRQIPDPPPPPPTPTFDDAGNTTLALLYGDERHPWTRADANLDEGGGLVMPNKPDLDPAFRGWKGY